MSAWGGKRSEDLVKSLAESTPPDKVEWVAVDSVKKPYARPFNDATDRGNTPRTRSYSFGNEQFTVFAEQRTPHGGDPTFTGRQQEVFKKRTDRVHTHDRPQGRGAHDKPDTTAAVQAGTVSDAGQRQRTATVAAVSSGDSYSSGRR